MSITESQAKGLTTRFFSETSEEMNKVVSSAKLNREKVKRNLNGFKKFMLKVNKQYDKFSLVAYEGGSKRKPYFAFCCLTLKLDREYNSWQEKCLAASSVVYSYDAVINDDLINLFNVGEHVITRLFQRGEFAVDEAGLPITSSIIPEFKLLPIWAPFWMSLIVELRQDDAFFEIYPVVPAKNGLFMAEYNAENPAMLEIRTFIDDSHLDERQLQVKNLLIQASDGFQSSPMAFYPFINEKGLDYTAVQREVMSYRIAKNSKLIADEVCHRIKDHALRIKSKKGLIAWIKKDSASIEDEFSETYKNLNIREINNKVRDHLVRNPKLDNTK